MIKLTTKIFFIGLSFLPYYSYGMLPAERDLIVFLENPTAPQEGSFVNADDMRRASLLSFREWKTSTSEFKDRLGLYIQNSALFVAIQSFMQDAVWENPSYNRQNQPDGSSIFIKRFTNRGQAFVMVQHSLNSDMIAIINNSFNPRCVHKLPFNAVYPVFIGMINE